MGFDLRRGDSCFSVSVFTWVRAYALAIEGGWEPQGTLPPVQYSDENESWPGTYDSNDGQIIEAEDANEMADALEEMLLELKETTADNRTEIDRQGDPFALWGGRVSALDYFSIGGKRKVLEALIEFLRGGACEIW